MFNSALTCVQEEYWSRDNYHDPGEGESTIPNPPLIAKSRLHTQKNKETVNWKKSKQFIDAEAVGIRADTVTLADKYLPASLYK